MEQHDDHNLLAIIAVSHLITVTINAIFSDGEWGKTGEGRRGFQNKELKTQ